MIDLIIVNYRSTDYLQACLRSIYNAIDGMSVNIHVFDNGSGDNLDLIKDAFPDTTVLKHKRNLGYSKAVNRVLNNTSSPYTVFLNPDTIVKNDFFKSVKSFMDCNPNVGIVGPKILDPDGCVQGSARAFPTFRSALAGRRSLLTKMFPNSRITCANILSNNCDGKTPMEVDWVSGACMFARRKALEDVGLFDERFFLYWEDVDLCHRISSKNWKVIYYPLATVGHYVGGSSERSIFRSVFEFHKSAYLYFMKYFKSHRYFFRPLILIGISVRFLCILLLQSMRRMILKFRQKSKTMNNPFTDLAN